MTFAPGDPQFLPRPFVGRPGTVYSRPTWPYLPPGVPYAPTRYMNAASYGVPVPPGVPQVLIEAANGLGRLLGFGETAQEISDREISRLETARIAREQAARNQAAKQARIAAEQIAAAKRARLVAEAAAAGAGADVPEPAEDAPSRASGGSGGLPSWALPVMIGAGVVALGGILLVLAKAGNKPKRRRNARRRNQGQFEIVYSTGGHSGPFPSQRAAEIAAEGRIRGNRNERWIAVVHNRDVPNLWDALAVNVLGRQSEDMEAGWSGPLEMRHLIGYRRRNAGWRQGARVQYTPDSMDLYIDRQAARGRPHPQPGDHGTVTAIPLGGRSRTTLPGPGGGLVYVDWDTTGIQGVSPGSLTRMTASRRRNWKEVGRRTNAVTRWGTKITPSYWDGYDDGFAGLPKQLTKTFNAQIKYDEGYEQGQIEAQAERRVARRYHEV